MTKEGPASQHFNMLADIKPQPAGRAGGSQGCAASALSGQHPLQGSSNPRAVRGLAAASRSLSSQWLSSELPPAFSIFLFLRGQSELGCRSRAYLWENGGLWE